MVYIKLDRGAGGSGVLIKLRIQPTTAGSNAQIIRSLPIEINLDPLHYGRGCIGDTKAHALKHRYLQIVILGVKSRPVHGHAAIEQRVFATNFECIHLFILKLELIGRVGKDHLDRIRCLTRDITSRLSIISTGESTAFKALCKAEVQHSVINNVPLNINRRQPFVGCTLFLVFIVVRVKVFRPNSRQKWIDTRSREPRIVIGKKLTGLHVLIFFGITKTNGYSKRVAKVKGTLTKCSPRIRVQ